MNEKKTTIGANDVEDLHEHLIYSSKRTIVTIICNKKWMIATLWKNSLSQEVDRLGWGIIPLL